MQKGINDIMPRFLKWHISEWAAAVACRGTGLWSVTTQHLKKQQLTGVALH